VFELNPADKNHIYFRATVPIGFISQRYNNNISIEGS